MPFLTLLYSLTATLSSRTFYLLPLILLIQNRALQLLLSVSLSLFHCLGLRDIIKPDFLFYFFYYNSVWLQYKLNNQPQGQQNDTFNFQILRDPSFLFSLLSFLPLCLLSDSLGKSLVFFLHPIRTQNPQSPLL